MVCCLPTCQGFAFKVVTVENVFIGVMVRDIQTTAYKRETVTEVEALWSGVAFLLQV